MDAPGPAPAPSPPSPAQPGGAEQPKAAPPGPPLPDDEGPGLLQRLFQARASFAFLIASGVVIWLCWSKDQGLFFNAQTLVDHGWYSWPKVRDEGQWWRFFSTLYVSRDGIDAFFYIWLFLGLAPTAEKALGSVRFAAMYLLAGAGGVALGEVFSPGYRSVGTITAVYALLGAIPGLVFGSTLSLKKTLTHPSVSSAAFYVIMILLLSYMVKSRGGVSPVDTFSLLGAMSLGALLGAGLILTRIRPALGWAVSLGLSALVAGMLLLAINEYAVRDGKLEPRGRPPGMDGPDRPLKPPPPKDPLGTPERAESDADRARAKVAPFLQRFGPLPTGTIAATGEMALPVAEHEKAQDLEQELDKLARGTNLVLGQLDPERVKLKILLGRYQDAARLADEYLALKPSAEARALAGAAYLGLGGEEGLEQARTYLESATDQEGVPQQLPEALYHVGCIYLKRDDRVAAVPWLERFLGFVGRDPNNQNGPWRRPMVEHALAELGQ